MDTIANDNISGPDTHHMPPPLNSVLETATQPVAYNMTCSLELSDRERYNHRVSQNCTWHIRRVAIPKTDSGHRDYKWKKSGDCRNVPRLANPQNWELDTGECPPEDFRWTVDNRWNKFASSFNMHMEVLFRWIPSVRKPICSVVLPTNCGWHLGQRKNVIWNV